MTELPVRADPPSTNPKVASEIPIAPMDLVDDLPTSSRAAEVRTAVEMADKITARLREAETDRDRYRDLAATLIGTLDAIWTGAVEGKPPNPTALAERINRFKEELRNA